MEADIDSQLIRDTITEAWISLKEPEFQLVYKVYGRNGLDKVRPLSWPVIESLIELTKDVKVSGYDEDTDNKEVSSLNLNEYVKEFISHSTNHRQPTQIWYTTPDGNKKKMPITEATNYPGQLTPYLEKLKINKPMSYKYLKRVHTYLFK